MENEAARQAELGSKVKEERSWLNVRKAGFPGTLCLANIRCRFATLSNRGRDAGWDGKRWVGRRAFPTLGGQEVGKWCSFSHVAAASTRLFPHNSTQVVDFPHLAMVRLFSEGHGIGFSDQAELGTNQAGLGTNIEELK